MTLKEGWNTFGLLPAKEFHSCILTTFSFNFNYFHHVARPALAKAGILNVSIFLDDGMLQGYLGILSEHAASAATRYSLTGISRRGSFHPKIQTYLGNESGALILGSGNLTSAGQGGNCEAWGAFHVQGASDPKAPLFKKAWDYASALGRETQGISREKLVWMQEHSPWLERIPIESLTNGVPLGRGDTGYLLLDGDPGIFAQMATIVGARRVLEITLISPFFDRQATVFRALSERFPEAKIRVFVQEESCSAEFSAIRDASIAFHAWVDPRYLHAKLMTLRTDNTEFCLVGSANMTAAGLGLSAYPRTNAEACLLLARESGHWLDDLGVSIPADLLDVGSIRTVEPGDGKETGNGSEWRIRILALDRKGDVLELHFSGSLDSGCLALFDPCGVGIGVCALPRLIDTVASIQVKFPEGVPSSRAFYGVVQNPEGIPLSNKHVIHDAHALFRTNPDPRNQKWVYIESRFEDGDLDYEGLLSVLDPEEMLARPNGESRSQGGGKTNNGSEKSDGTGEILPYDAWASEDPSTDTGRSWPIGNSHQHPVERFMDTLSWILKALDTEVGGDFDEESDKDSVESSQGKMDIPAPEPQTAKASASQLRTMRKRFHYFISQYLRILAKQNASYVADGLDLSVFTLALHLLVVLNEKPFRVAAKGTEGTEEPFLTTGGEYSHQEDIAHIATEVIGRFTLILKRGIMESRGSAAKERCERRRREAFWYGLAVLSRLPEMAKTFFPGSDPTPMWRWSLGMNLRYYLLENTALTEDEAVRASKYCASKMSGVDKSEFAEKLLGEWRFIEAEYEEVSTTPLTGESGLDAWHRCFSEVCGFAHVNLVEARSNGDLMAWISRPGYNGFDSRYSWTEKGSPILANKVRNIGRLG